MSRADEITPEVPRRSTPRRAALFVVGVVVVFLLLNAGARWYLQRNGGNFGYRIVYAKWTLLQTMDEPVDWLVLGDSAGCHGIVPEIWGEQLGGSVVNLATLADLLVVEDAWMLQRYIERHGPPAHVVLVHAYDVWHRGYRSALVGKIPEPWGFWERLRPPLEFDFQQEKRLFLSRYVPLYAENGTLRKHLARFGRATWTFSMSESGFIPAFEHRPVAFARDIARVRRFVGDKGRFEVSPLNRDALRVIGELAREHGFEVLILNGPMHDRTAAMPAFARYQRNKLARLESLTRPYSQMHVIDHLATYAAREMETCVDHVIPEMAPDYTREMASAVMAWRAARPDDSAGGRR